MAEPDLLMLIEEQRASIREAERDLTEALGAKAEWEKKIGYLQWYLERLKRLYTLTSTAAQHETRPPAQRGLPISPLPQKPKSGRPGTTKQAIIDVLRENRRPMLAREIWNILSDKGIKIRSPRPIEVVASIMRSSIARNQNIFTKDGTKFGLVEWQGSRST